MGKKAKWAKGGVKHDAIHIWAKWARKISEIKIIFSVFFTLFAPESVHHTSTSPFHAKTSGKYCVPHCKSKRTGKKFCLTEESLLSSVISIEASILIGCLRSNDLGKKIWREQTGKVGNGANGLSPRWAKWATRQTGIFTSGQSGQRGKRGLFLARIADFVLFLPRP